MRKIILSACLMIATGGPVLAQQPQASRVPGWSGFGNVVKFYDLQVGQTVIECFDMRLESRGEPVGTDIDALNMGNVIKSQINSLADKLFADDFQSEDQTKTCQFFQETLVSYWTMESEMSRTASSVYYQIGSEVSLLSRRAPGTPIQAFQKCADGVLKYELVKRLSNLCPK